MPVQDFDLYALKNYSFAVKKTNTYFSLPSLLLSLTILSLSVLINFSTIQHLWLSRSQLPIVLTQATSYPKPLTQGYACFTSSNNYAPNAILLDSSSTVIPKPVKAKKQMVLLYPGLFDQIDGDFGCLSLQGIHFSSQMGSVHLQVKASSAQLFVKGLSKLQLVDGSTSPLMSCTADSTLSCEMKLNVQETIFYDSLFLNTPPETHVSFQHTPTLDLTSSPPATPSNHTRFTLTYSIPKFYFVDNLASDYNLWTTILTRYTFPYILGALLSWVSILVLLFGLVAAPLMDKQFNLITAQMLYHQPPQQPAPTLTRFAIASLKKGLFPNEDRFVRMCEQLQNMKDVNAIVKLQLLLARLSPKTNKHQEQQVSAEHNFNGIQTEPAIDSFSIINSNKLKESRSQDKAELDFSSEQKQSLCVSNLRHKLLCFVDSGSDGVSVSYSQGGIGSKESALVGMLFMAGFWALLFYFGVFSQSESYSKYSNITSTVQVQIDASHLVFAQSPPGAVNWTIVDSSYTPIATAPIFANDSCRQFIPASELSSLPSNTAFYCVQQPMSLRFSHQPGQVRQLYLNFNNYQGSLLYYHTFDIEVEGELAPYFRRGECSTWQQQTRTVYAVNIRKLSFDNGTLRKQEPQFMPANAEPETDILSVDVSGMVWKVQGGVLTVSADQPGWAATVQNVWSLATVCFSVVLFKLTKYINLRKKQQTLSPQLSEFRDSFCLLLARLHALKHGRHRDQLTQIRHYLKERLP